MSNLDNNIKNKLEGFRSEVNPNMWAKIESALPQVEKTTTRNLLWPVFGVALVASLLTGYYLMNQSDSNLIDSNASDLTTDVSNTNAISEMEESLMDNITDFENHTALNENQTSLVTNINNNQKENFSTSKNNKISKGISKSTSEFNENNTFENSNGGGLQNEGIVKSNQNSGAHLAANKTNVGAILENSGKASLYQQYNSILKATKSNQVDNIKIIEREREDLDFLNFNPMNLNNEQADLNFILDGMANKRTICPTFKNVRFGIFAEAFYSNDFGLRDLSYNYFGEGNYLDERNNTESANYSFSAGARVSFIMPNGLGAKTGFTYSQINETFKYLDESHRKTKTIIIKEYIWENNIIIDSISTSEEIEVEGALNVKSQNKYKSFDLPLLVTYEWGYKNRLYYSITGGPMFNIKFSQKGKFLNPETLSPVDFTTGDGNYQAFKTNIGTSVYLAFAINYQLGNGADIFVEPNMRHNLNSTTLNSYELNQKYTVFGLGFGIKYKL